MNKMKSLAEQLRQAVNEPPADNEKTGLPEDEPKKEIDNKKSTPKRKEVKKHNNKRTIKSDPPENDISRRINELSFDEEEVEPVTIRFPKKLYSKLRLLGNEKLSIQKLTVYAVDQLLESDEIKSKLKNILKNLNE